MRNYSFAPGEFYHIYSRGVEKRQVFMDSSDHSRFRKLLFYCNGTKPTALRNIPRGLSYVDGAKYRGEPIVEIGAFCLMPNHFHLLIREPTGQGVSLFMRKLLSGYSTYFNLKYDRKGRLFESSFQARHADSDEYLKYLFAYIHMNPLKLIDPEWKTKGLKDIPNAFHFLEKYEASSFGEQLGTAPSSGITNTSNFPDYFQNRDEVAASIGDWINYTTYTT